MDSSVLPKDETLVSARVPSHFRRSLHVTHAIRVNGGGTGKGWGMVYDVGRIFPCKAEVCRSSTII